MQPIKLPNSTNNSSTQQPSLNLNSIQYTPRLNFKLQKQLSQDCRSGIRIPAQTVTVKKESSCSLLTKSIKSKLRSLFATVVGEPSDAEQESDKVKDSLSKKTRQNIEVGETRLIKRGMKERQLEYDEFEASCNKRQKISQLSLIDEVKNQLDSQHKLLESLNQHIDQKLDEQLTELTKIDRQLQLSVPAIMRDNFQQFNDSFKIQCDRQNELQSKKIKEDTPLQPKLNLNCEIEAQLIQKPDLELKFVIDSQLTLSNQNSFSTAFDDLNPEQKVEGPKSITQQASFILNDSPNKSQFNQISETFAISNTESSSKAQCNSSESLCNEANTVNPFMSQSIQLNPFLVQPLIIQQSPFLMQTSCEQEDTEMIQDLPQQACQILDIVFSQSNPFLKDTQSHSFDGPFGQLNNPFINNIGTASITTKQDGLFCMGRTQQKKYKRK